MALLHHKSRPFTSSLILVILILDVLRIAQGGHETTQECQSKEREPGPEFFEALDNLNEHEGSDLQLLQMAGRSLTRTLYVEKSVTSTEKTVGTSNNSVFNRSSPKSTSFVEETKPATLTGSPHVLFHVAATALLQAATEVKDNNKWWFVFGIFAAAVLVGLVLEFMLLEFSRVGMAEVGDIADDVSETDQSSLRTRDSSMLAPRKFPHVPTPESMAWPKPRSLSDANSFEHSPALRSVAGLSASTLPSGKLMAQEAVLAGGGHKVPPNVSPV